MVYKLYMISSLCIAACFFITSSEEEVKNRCTWWARRPKIYHIEVPDDVQLDGFDKELPDTLPPDQAMRDPEKGHEQHDGSTQEKPALLARVPGICSELVRTTLYKKAASEQI